jgi:hypothetical protein
MNDTSTHRILVVANQTCECESVRDQIRERAQTGGQSEVLILAPALNSRLKHWVSDTDDALVQAEQRVANTVESLRRGGVHAEGQVGDADPFNAIEDTLHTYDAGEIVISTHPPEHSHWLETDLLARTRAAFDGPVTHVVSKYGLG